MHASDHAPDGRHCPACGCDRDAVAHAIVAALLSDDVDRALDLGLLDADECAACSTSCRAAVHAARGQRQRALAARERFRARNARLQRRAEERAAQRQAPAPSPASVTPPSLPSAAAAALERARAKAAARHKP